MTLDEQKDRIESLMESAGFSRLCPVEHQFLVNDVDIWTGTLRTGWGNAKFEVRAYRFSDRPELVVDYEEDKDGLNIGRKQTEGWSDARVLLHAARTSDLGVLLTCRASDEQLFRELPPEFAPGRYSYHPQSDRVLGGDYFRDINGKPAKGCIMSLRRAQELYPLMNDLAEAFEKAPAWPGKLEYPFPAPLVVFALSEELLGPGNVPAEYRELALVISLIDNVLCLLDSRPGEEFPRQSCVTQIFRGMRVAHGNRFSFWRPTGGNYLPKFVTPAGALSDAYFLWRDPALKQAEELWQSQETDLINGMLTVADLQDGPDTAKCQLLLESVRAYFAPANVRNDIVELVLDPGGPGADFVRHVKRVAAAVLATTVDF